MTAQKKGLKKKTIPFILAMVAPVTAPDRWFSFIEIFLSIFAGFGIFIIYRFLSKHKLNLLMPFVAAAMIFFIVASPTVNPNGQIFSNELSSRMGLVQSEINAVNFLKEFNDQSIYGNTRYITYINRTFWNFGYFINPNDVTTYKNHVLAIRNDDLKFGFYFPLYGAGGRFIDIIYPDAQFYAYLNASNILYKNNEVAVYK